MGKLNEGVLDMIDSFLIFVLRKDKDAAEKFVKNHPELKAKRKEIDKRLKAVHKKFKDSSYMDTLGN